MVFGKGWGWNTVRKCNAFSPESSAPAGPGRAPRGHPQAESSLSRQEGERSREVTKVA